MLAGYMRNKGANVYYEIRGEVLVDPGEIINGWTQRLTNRIMRYTREAAPSHNYAKRPLRPHGGQTLKESIMRGRTRTRKITTGGAVFSAVGSSAGHAAFVDQGTQGTLAKVLPPWSPGSPTLFEATWSPKGGAPVGPKMVKGQQARHFFEAGTARAFAYMRMRSFQVPGNPAPGGLSAHDMGWEEFFGNTQADAGFKARLEEWRRWKYEAYNDPRWQKRNSAKKYRKRAQERDRAKAQREAAENLRRSQEAALKRALEQNAKILASQAAAERRKKEEAKRKKAEQREAERLSRLTRERVESRREAEAYIKSIRKSKPGVRTSVEKAYDEQGNWVGWSGYYFDEAKGEWVGYTFHYA